MEVGTVITLNPGEPATVVNSGTEAAAVLDFGIPKGEVGETGSQGPQGIPGVISATSPITYNAGTQTVGFDTTWNPFNQTLNTGDQVGFQSVLVQGPDNAARGLFNQGIYATNSSASVGVILSETGVNIFGGADLRFPDSSVQTTAYLGGDLKAANNLSDLANAGTARSNLGLGTIATEAAADYAAKAAANTFTEGQVIETTSAGAALRVTQLGTGEAFRVEDSANPDSTPFIIDSAGNVGIGISTTSNKLLVSGTVYFGHGSGTNGANLTFSNSAGVSIGNGTANTNPALLVTNFSASGASFRVNDEASDTTPFIVDSGGNVGVKTASPGTDFEVNGNAKFTTGEIVTAPAAGDSSAKIPTTAWVQAEVPAASTTVAGKVELATDAEAVAGTSANTVLTPSAWEYANRQEIIWDITANDAQSATTSGTGASAGVTNGFGRQIVGPTSAIGYANGRYTIAGHTPGQNWNSAFNFDKVFILDALVGGNNNTMDANSEGWVTVGDGGTIANNGAPDRKGFGIKFVGNDIYGFIHDGTALSLSTFYHTNTGGPMFPVSIVSNGAGAVSFNLDGTTFVMTGGPTGLNSIYGNAVSFKSINNAALTNSNCRFFVTKCRLKIKV